ncbi:hypothetical protein BJ875DRAFT_533823 [Amylocarpus encephaloides]|uniref:Uncharacterized protein n=1 Tax=Amylocarpus encephaloides TaxID=45428 RepID=A0A9P7YML6_9HELO|nr:hypothetical protein BJ875DRAFT_533823 [Amylocarpus encephaloides]
MDDYMFEVHLNRCKSIKEETTYLEIFSYSDQSFNTIQENPLTDDEFNDYLDQKGTFSPPELPEGLTRLESMRLILQKNAKNPETLSPCHISLTAKQYKSMVRAMHLPQRFIESTTCVGPFFCAAWDQDEENPHLQIVMRKSDLRRRLTRGWELTLSHDVNTATTTGFCKGTPSSDIVNCIAHLKACISQTAHPLLLPTIIFSHEVSFQNDIKQREARNWLRQIEHALSMGRDTHYVDKKGVTQFDTLAAEITECHSQVIWKNPKAYLKILAGLEGSLHKFWEELPKQRRGKETRQLHNSMLARLAFYKARLQGIDSYANTTLQRLGVQRAALYNMMAQKESKLSFEMAREQRKPAYASTRDSAAMKSVSLLGAIFLPGAYLAAPAMSESFWIYWAFTIPITLGVVGGWLWYERKQDYIENQENNKDGQLEKNMEVDIVNKMRVRIQQKISTWEASPNIRLAGNENDPRRIISREWRGGDVIA